MKKIKKNPDPLTPEQRERYEKARKELKKKLEPMRRACDEAHRITADIFQTRINY